MSGYNKPRRLLSSLFGLTLVSSLLLVMCLQAVSVEGSTKTVAASPSDDGDEKFFDAKSDAFEIMDSDDENADIWHDAEGEFNYGEDSQETVCASPDVSSCPTCCHKLGLDLSHWNMALSQCYCYRSEADETICKTSYAGGPTVQTCKLCCTNNHYGQSFLSERTSTCYCSLLDERLSRRATTTIQSF